jgi:hypothetical protein
VGGYGVCASEAADWLAGWSISEGDGSAKVGSAGVGDEEGKTGFVFADSEYVELEYVEERRGLAVEFAMTTAPTVIPTMIQNPLYEADMTILPDVQFNLL